MRNGLVRTVFGGQLSYAESKLWQRTLGGSFEEERAERSVRQMQVAFGDLRERIAPIVARAHLDCEGLTVHDLSHLDALWSMADLIAGADYPLNPVEAFVFGCAVLLHDAALSSIAFEGGAEKLRETETWKRAVEANLRAERYTVNEALIRKPPPHIEKRALFSTLRELHAQQAEALLEREWLEPDGKTLYLMDSSELRSFYGQSIGRIAHSHHWDVQKLINELNVAKGVYPDFPPEWSLNEVKVALLLRSVDAAHIDRRRASTINFVLINPQGISEKHWRFQHKIGSPVTSENKLVYTSSRDFSPTESEAWWLCLDTCRMIARELAGANLMLREIGAPEFEISDVEGVQSPKLFAKYVRTDGWLPVDAEVRVTDPIHLARTLGGANLYGQGFQAPIRELLQNALDSTLLREQAELARGNSRYRRYVRISLAENSGEFSIRIEDNGLGMSERVLTLGLLDFGKSLWQAQADASGAKSPFVEPAGKFGIGFFSVFLLGDRVTVESRPFDKGVSEALTLDFIGLHRRPIVMPGTKVGFESDISTRIEVVIKDAPLINGILPDTRAKRTNLYPYRQEVRDLFDYIRWLTASAEAEIECVDGVGARSFTHRGWQQSSNTKLLANLAVESEVTDGTIESAAAQMSDLVKAGTIIGRAAINLGYGVAAEYVRIGGLTYPFEDRQSTTGHYIPRFVGILPGSVSLATRSKAMVHIEKNCLSAWATEQASLGLEQGLGITEKMHLAHEVYRSGGDPGELPFAFMNGSLITLSSFSNEINKLESISIPIDQPLSTSSEWISMSKAGAELLLDRVEGNFLILEAIGASDVFEGHRYGAEEETFDLGKFLSEDVVRQIDFEDYDLLFSVLGKSIEECEFLPESKAMRVSSRPTQKLQPVITVVFNRGRA